MLRAEALMWKKESESWTVELAGIYIRSSPALIRLAGLRRPQSGAVYSLISGAEDKTRARKGRGVNFGAPPLSSKGRIRTRMGYEETEEKKTSI